MLLTFTALSWLLSMLISNTATAVMLTPLAGGIIDTARFKSIMGLLFGGELSDVVLQSICHHYGCNGIDAGGLDHVSIK